MKNARSMYGTTGGFIVGLLVAGLLAPLLFASETTTVAAGDDGLAGGDFGSDSFDSASDLGTDAGTPGALDDAGEAASAGEAGSGSDGSTAGTSGGATTGGGAGGPAVGAAGGGSGGSGGGGGTAARTASDRGVTPDTVKIGVPILDLGSLAQYGVETETSGLEEQKTAFNAIIADYNKKGGIQGRQIEVVFTPYNPLEPDDMRAACQKMIEDDKVFAIVAQVFYGDPVLCVTERFKTPLILDDGTSDEFYRRSGGYLFSTQQGKARAIRNQIWMLHEMGILKGKTIGALVSEINGDADAPDEALESTLNLYGYELTHEARATSIETLASEIQVHVQQMKAKGVDFVILTQASTLWDDEAERQNFRPDYSTSDFSQKTRDSSVEGHGEHFDGTIGISSMLWSDRGGNVPETAATRRCLDRAAANGSGPYERGETLYDVQVGACNVLDVFALGAKATGVELTRPRISKAIQNLGVLELANMNGAAFRPGKFDLPETVRPTRWSVSCKCYSPIGPFRPAKH